MINYILFWKLFWWSRKTLFYSEHQNSFLTCYWRVLQCKLHKNTLQSLIGKYRDLQGNPCNENRGPVLRTGVPCNENRVFPVWIDLQGVPWKPYRVWVCSAMKATITSKLGCRNLLYYGNPNWYERRHFYLLVLLESDFVSWIFIKKNSKLFWRWKLISIRANLTPC